jgi:hypothetical protein
MGILASIGSWVMRNLPTVVKIVKKAADLVSKSAAVVEALLEGKKLVNDVGPSTTKPKSATEIERPNLVGDEDKKPSNDFSMLVERIDESRNKLASIKNENEIEHRRIQLQIDIMELLVSAQTFERFTNNINLHAANLQIHIHTIQNSAGMLDDINRQRVAIKALMGSFNHLVNVLGVGDKVKKIEGINIDIKPGAVSIHGAYEAFENTRTLLLNEIDSFHTAIGVQLTRVENVRSTAKHIPGISSKISYWIEKSVEPRLLDAKANAESLKGELSVIPRLEASLRKELETIREEGL